MLESQHHIGQTVIRLKHVVSTNLYLEKLVSTNEALKEGTIVVADQQTGGLGLDKNTWESEPGKNLTLSIFLQPGFLSAGEQFFLNMAISLGVYDFVAGMIPAEPVSIKWPNDVYIRTDKVAGILIRHAVSRDRILHSIIGIGLNVNQQSFSKELPNPVSLIRYTKNKPDLTNCLERLCRCLDKRYDQLKNMWFTMLKDQFSRKLFRVGEWHLFRYKGNISSGKIRGVDQFGRLQLELKDHGLVICDIKEVSFVV